MILRAIPLPYLILAVCLLVTSAYALGRAHGASSVREDYEHKAALLKAKVAKAETKSANESIKVVTEYVDRIQQVEVRVPVVRDRLVRVCDKASDRVVPGGARDPHAPAAADASDRRVDELAADLIACRKIKETLTSFQAWKRANGG